ncbi:hypothetical protein [Streptomyces jumonjinensis]|uniref:hypothetical protein n=1 Tax=Streptomyces jumonjinensis TaxID=1945 RepID=UPI0037AC7C8B
MALDVRMSPDVEVALGPQMALQARAVPEGTCIECRQSFTADEPVNVVLGQSTVATLGSIWFAHDRCSPSRIVPLDAEATAAVVQPEDGLDMAMTPGLLDGHAVLIAEMVTPPVTDSGVHGAEPRSLFMQVMLEEGFGLITGAAGLDAPTLGEWVAVIQPYGADLRCIVLTETGTRFYDGTLPKPPPGWIAAARQGGALLVGGDIGLHRATDPDRQREALTTAAAAGQLAGGRVRCGRPVDFGLA